MKIDLDQLKRGAEKAKAENRYVRLTHSAVAQIIAELAAARSNEVRA